MMSFRIQTRFQTIEEMPDGNAARHRHVERMLCAALRNLQADIALIHNPLVYTVYLVTEYKGIAAPGFGTEILQADAALHLLESAYDAPLASEAVYAGLGRFIIIPAYGILGAESRLVDFWRRRHGAYAAERDALYRKSIAGTENRPYVVETPYVVENDCERKFRTVFETFDAQTPEIPDCFLFHAIGD